MQTPPTSSKMVANPPSFSQSTDRSGSKTRVLHTEELLTKVTNLSTMEKTAVKIERTSRMQDGIPLYRIIDVKSTRELGTISMDAATEGMLSFKNVQPFLYISQMHSHQGGKKDRTLSGVGTALHEAAIRLSVDLGLEGRVGFDADWGSDLFHLKSGYRYENNQRFSARWYDRAEKKVCRAFLKDKATEAEVRALKCFPKLKRDAEMLLEKETDDVTEILETIDDHGFILDPNRQYELLQSSPDHPESVLKTRDFCQGGFMFLKDEVRKQWLERFKQA